MKKILIALAALPLIVGCAKLPISASLIEQGAKSLVKFDTAKWPATVPAVTAGIEIVCAAGNGTNISPSVIIAGLQSNPNWTALQTPEATFIMDGLIAGYTLAWNVWGTDTINNLPELKLDLQAICTGGRAGLPGAPVTLMSPKAAELAWPHLSFQK